MKPKLTPEEVKEKRKRYLAEYMREYRKKNPVKTAAIHERYWRKRAERERENEKRGRIPD